MQVAENSYTLCAGMNISRLSLLLLLACVVSANAQRREPPDRLPPNFSGDDPAILLPKLIDLRKRLLKDEFETTPAYEARVIEEEKKPLIDRRTIETTYLLVADRIHADYNADTQVMTFSLPVETNYDGDVISRDNVDKKTITSLARLAKYQVSLGGDTDPHVFFDRAPGLYGPGPQQNFTVTAKLNAADARRLKNHTKAVLFVRFEEPYATTAYQEGGQFLVQLSDVFFFDEQTSIILGKVSSPQIASPAKQEITPTPDPDYSTYRKNPSFKLPRILSKPDPSYSQEALRKKITGRVLLHVLFSKTGQINDIQVVKGLPYGLTERAVAAAR